MNILDILILAIVACGVVFAVRRIRATRKSGGCGCGCSGCSKAGTAAGEDCGKKK